MPRGPRPNEKRNDPMFAHHGRKVLLAALLAAALVAPVSASDGTVTTTQMTQMSQSVPDVVAMSNAPATAEESSQIETRAPAAMPRARQKMTELRPTYVAGTPAERRLLPAVGADAPDPRHRPLISSTVSQSTLGPRSSVGSGGALALGKPGQLQARALQPMPRRLVMGRLRGTRHLHQRWSFLPPFCQECASTRIRDLCRSRSSASMR